MSFIVNPPNDMADVVEIGTYIANSDYETASEKLGLLNEERIVNGKSPYEIGDILFMNIETLMSCKENGPELKAVYIAEFEDGTVKIGVSKNPEARINTLSNQKGCHVKRYAISEMTTNAFQVEHKLHEQFKLSRIKGEYFNLDYLDAVKEAKQQIAMIGG